LLRDLASSHAPKGLHPQTSSTHAQSGQAFIVQHRDDKLNFLSDSVQEASRHPAKVVIILNFSKEILDFFGSSHPLVGEFA
jgi:hypothetical protein